MVQTIQKRSRDSISKELNYRKPSYIKNYHGHLNTTAQESQGFSIIAPNLITSILVNTRQITSRRSRKTSNIIYGAYPSNWIEISDSIKATYSLSVCKKVNLLNKANDIRIKDLKITIDRIKGLLEEDEEDEYGEIIIPAEYSIQTAIELVSKAANLIPQRFFKAWVSTEDSGGVVLTWSKPQSDKKVRLVLPSKPDCKTYLYHEIADEYGIEYNVSAKTLSHWLSWCNSR
jgi:hypothetical protein